MDSVDSDQQENPHNIFLISQLKRCGASNENHNMCFH